MTDFTPALIVVDFQEDFCPPNGSLAVPDGRSIAPAINSLLRLPFALKVATRDWHPPDHISFASTHNHQQQQDQGQQGQQKPPVQPFTSSHTITHPSSGARYTTTLWPVHCVAGTPGAALVPELDAARLDRVLDKGRRADREMYSAFRDPFGESDSGLAAALRAAGVTHVYVAGLALDYCVRATAEHAAELGFATAVLDDATRAVFPDARDGVLAALRARGVDVVPCSAAAERVASGAATQSC
ncbi:hypothetical protein V2A60_000693 [Cordyceps javanica]